MLKEHPKLKKLWNRMNKKAAKGKGEIISFDKRFKETKDFLKEFGDMAISSFNKKGSKEIKMLNGLVNFALKGRSKRKSSNIK